MRAVDNCCGLSKKWEVKTLLRFFHWFGNERGAAFRFICSDMWQPYLKVVSKKAAKAAHVLDRFHIKKQLGKAIDDVRAQEVKTLKAEGYEPILKRTRWLLLKRSENLARNKNHGWQNCFSTTCVRCEPTC